VREVIGDSRRLEDMGRFFKAGLSEREVAYLAENEWAITPEDILWRRTKAGLHFATEDARAAASASIEALL
jgi:glycerol-3-phosphate dehydrogenase